MEERKSNFELLRVLSILLIVSYHYVFHGGLKFQGITVNKIINDIFYMFGELGVNCFILISSYFLTTLARSLLPQFFIKKFFS